MTTWDTTNHYFSGQGIVLIGDRSSLGKPAGLIPVGNVSDLKIAIATSVLEHKESYTGQRGVDLRLTTETKASLSMTIENFNAENLKNALRGSKTTVSAGTGASENIKGYQGMVTPLSKSKISTFTSLKRAAQALTLYTNDSTAWDYKINLAAGSIMINDGSGISVDKLTVGGTAPTAISVGSTTDFTVDNTALGAVVGDYLTVTGLTGADAALMNGKAFRVTQVSTTHVWVDYNSTAKTITIGTPLTFLSGTTLAATYDHNAQYLVDALTTNASEKYMRFEGLNTAESDNPVIVEVFKFLVDPLKELALIGDGIGQFVLEGSVLADPLQTSGSKYFKQIMLS